ncbi:MAG: hypothetical protein GQ538_00405 [Xanthomonadales bacterium]|nr:hypothetical protein [Xanthomonadales bacterium]
MTGRSQKLLTLVVLLLSPLSGICQTTAQVPDYEPVHWAYSSFFGTGWYEIRDNRSIFVLRVPPRQTLRESGFSAAGEREVGISIQYPLTLGLHSIDDLSGIIDQDNFGTVSFTPGVELEVPINKKWYLRTFAHVGWGTELETSDSVWIYYAGVKSRYAFTKHKYDWDLLSGIYYAGFTPDKGKSDRLAVAQLGVELHHPLSSATIAGRAIDLHYNFMYSFLGRDLHFGLPEGDFDIVQDQLEAGIAMSFREGPYQLWFFKVDRLALGYKFTSKGQFKAITLSMSSWFNK